MMIVEHVRVYESPMGEVQITKDRAGWPEVADAVIRMHRARIQQKKAEGDECFNMLVERSDYASEELKHVKQLCRIRKRMKHGYCPYNRERYRLEDAYAV